MSEKQCQNEQLYGTYALTKEYDESGRYESERGIHPDGIEKLAMQEGRIRIPNKVIKVACKAAE